MLNNEDSIILVFFQSSSFIDSLRIGEDNIPSFVTNSQALAFDDFTNDSEMIIGV